MSHWNNYRHWGQHPNCRACDAEAAEEVRRARRAEAERTDPVLHELDRQHEALLRLRDLASPPGLLPGESKRDRKRRRSAACHLWELAVKEIHAARRRKEWNLRGHPFSGNIAAAG